ncbi:PucR family transcriptional regulator [Streptomyces caeruleatus]|uniref:Transcriptional regulator n=1 Tax=Streptomyces caeruleatus TaxID=661399 RepID=A0A101THM1_9ACTN|nr:helix-turn-helix domain-containing protein [Streptomyces caeruleatus]KUN92527.1 transcriptional regulator [Streptomyces caeruleatus]
MSDDWEMPSAAAQEIIRRGAEQALDPRPEWLPELNEAVLTNERLAETLSDPVLAERMRSSNLSNLLHWAAANVQRPGARVAANLNPVVLKASRDVVRRDLDATALDAWRLGQNVAWQRWMQICFELTRDAHLLQEVLAITSRSISTFIDDTIAAVAEVMRQERHELTQGTHAERLTTVSLLLEGAPVARTAAEASLGYALTGSHMAAIVWGGTDVTGEHLELAAEMVLRAAGAARRLTVLATSASLWLWLPVERTPGVPDLDTDLATIPGVRVALGRPRRDLDGFRQSHLEAAAVQRMMARLGTVRRAGSYMDAQLVALLSNDVGRADEFVADTLGDLARAEPELHLTLRTYLEEQCNAARAAESLYAHRNTIVRRLARCDELLPRPLSENPIAVGAALQLMWWRGQHLEK